MKESSLQHYLASVPLCVVLLDCSEYFMASSCLSLKTMGMGASRMSDPLPLLNLSPS